MIQQINVSAPVFRCNYNKKRNILNNRFTMPNDTFTKSVSFNGVVPREIKLEKGQYAISNTLSAKEAKITQSLFEAMPAGVMLAMLSNQENSKQKFKKIDDLQNLYRKENNLKGTELYDKAGETIFSQNVTAFANKGQKLEDDLFALNPASDNLKNEIKVLFAPYNMKQIEADAEKTISEIDTKKLKIAEINILNEAIQGSKTLDENSKKYIEGVVSYVDECLPYMKDKNNEEKLEVLKFADLTNYDAKKIKDELNLKYQEFLLNAKNKKNNLNYADEKKWTDENVENYFNDNALKITKAIMLAGNPSLNFQLDRKIDKVTRITSNVDNLPENYEFLNLIKEVTSKISEPENKTKILDFYNGFEKIGKEDVFINEINNLNKNNKINSKDLSEIGIKYIKNLTNNPELNNRNFAGEYSCTIPAMLDRLDTLNMKQHKDILPNLISTISSSIEQSKINYNNFLYDENTDIGKANLQTKQDFIKNNMNYDKWLNYDKEKEFLDNKTGEKLRLNVWERNVGFDLFQGNYSGICIATNGKNAFGAIDSLINTPVQIIEIANNKKTIGNAYVYFSNNPSTEKKAFVIDGISLDKDYEDSEDIKNNLLDYAYEYAKEVKGNNDFEFYAGDNYNSIDLKEFKEKHLTLTPIGNTGNRKFYLDSMAGSKYISIDSKKSYNVDVREI